MIHRRSGIPEKPRKNCQDCGEIPTKLDLCADFPGIGERALDDIRRTWDRSAFRRLFRGVAATNARSPIFNRVEGAWSLLARLIDRISSLIREIGNLVNPR